MVFLEFKLAAGRERAAAHLAVFVRKTPAWGMR